MKVLFLCKSNVTRSQMAEAFFNKYFKKEKAKSAALIKPQEKMHKLVIRAMADAGIDITNNKSKKVTKKMLDVNKIIVIGLDLIKYLNNIPEDKIEIWDIKDVVASEDDEEKYSEFIKIRDVIEKKVKDLIKD